MMTISRDKYVDVVNALDGIRCDNRENNHLIDKQRPLSDEVMQYIERKSYCKYIYGANCRFVRTLTRKGYEILQYMDYGKYKRKKAIENYQRWLPIIISIIALLVASFKK